MVVAELGKVAVPELLLSGAEAGYPGHIIEAGNEAHHAANALVFHHRGVERVARDASPR